MRLGYPMKMPICMANGVFRTKQQYQHQSPTCTAKKLWFAFGGIQKGLFILKCWMKEILSRANFMLNNWDESTEICVKRGSFLRAFGFFMTTLAPMLQRL